jgi:hypothetical protein
MSAFGEAGTSSPSCRRASCTMTMLERSSTSSGRSQYFLKIKKKKEKKYTYITPSNYHYIVNKAIKEQSTINEIAASAVVVESEETTLAVIEPKVVDYDKYWIVTTNCVNVSPKLPKNVIVPLMIKISFIKLLK